MSILLNLLFNNHRAEGNFALQGGVDTLLPAARKWAEERVQQGCKTFVAVGGDGTVHLAVNALLGLPIRLGAVGLGSSNDFHKPFHSKGRTRILGLHCRLDFDSAFAHDLGEAYLCSGAKRAFIANASVGFTAEANYYFNHAGPLFNWIKRKSTQSAIIVAAAREFFRFQVIPLEIKATGDSKVDSVRCHPILNLGIVKNPHFAGRFRYETRPHSQTDGFFGVFGCERMPRWQLVKVLTGLMRGKFSGQARTFSIRSSSIEIERSLEGEGQEFRKPFALEMDGEVTKVSHAKFRVIPQGMVVCP